MNITADVYPYTLLAVDAHRALPQARLRRPEPKPRRCAGRSPRPRDSLLAARAETTYVGKTRRQIAKIRHTDPATTLMALIKESAGLRQGAPGNENVEGVIATSMEADVAKLIAWPHTNICSDGALVDRHPRGIGTYPRVLGRYVREQKVIPLEEAIRKMSGLAAANVGLKRRGEIRPGYFADLVLFDPATVTDRATPLEPHRLSEGVFRVWVNGGLVFADGKTTGAYPGRAIRRGDH